MVKIWKFIIISLFCWLVVPGTSLAQQNPEDILMLLQQRLTNGQDIEGGNSGTNAAGYGAQRNAAGQQSRSQAMALDALQPASVIEQAYQDRFEKWDTSDKSKSAPKTRPQPAQDPRLADQVPQGLDPEDAPTLRQIGYQALQPTSGLISSPNMLGVVQDSYVLGVGDQLSVTMRGERNSTFLVTVGRDGQAIVPNLPPITAMGRTFGDFRDDLIAQIKSSMLQTEAFVTLGTVRQMSVLVSGEVQSPGTVSVTGLSSVLDALIQANGVRKSGTLRHIQLVRDGQTTTIDLYPVLLGGQSSVDLSLREGDRIVVPPIGGTVAIGGLVSRPGIYELAGKTIGAQELLQWAGGTLAANGNRYTKDTVAASGRAALVEIPASLRASLGRGDILVVQRAAQGTSGAINVVGHVTRPGWRALADVPTLRTLLSDRSNLGNEPYLGFVVVKRRNPATLAPEFQGVDATRLALGGNDYPLNDQDEVIVLSITDIRYLVSEDVLRAIKGMPALYGRVNSYDDVRNQVLRDQTVGTQVQQANRSAEQVVADRDRAARGEPLTVNQPNQFGVDTAAAAYLQTCKGLQVLARNAPIQGTPSLVEAGKSNKDLADVQICPEIYDQYADLMLYLMNNVMLLQGAVHSPGLYPVAEGGLLADAIGAAGGLLGEADPDGVEVTMTRNGATVRQVIPLSAAVSDYGISPRASVRVRQTFSDMDGGMVYLQGEVRYPGSYTLLRGERLSQVIERAGGLTQEAYILGSVFTRESVRKSEEESYRRMATDIEMAIPTTAQYVTQNSDSADVGAALSTLERVANILRNATATGRMVIDASPAGLQSNPESDIILHSGDRLFVPRRPAHITITGEVMHDGAQSFKPGLPADEYIRRAGGLRESADEDRIYVILPDGTAQPLAASYWNYKETQIPPGSTIVVPRDMSPIMWWSLTKNAVSILGNVALSAAALASISN